MTTPDGGPEIPPRDEPRAESGPRSTAPLAVEPTPIADGREHALDPRSVTVERLGGAVGLAVVSVGLAIANGVTVFTTRFVGAAPKIVLAGSLVVASIVAWSTLVLPALRYRKTRYRLDGDALRIRRGVVWHSSAVVPRDRVQHTDITQGPIERSFGIASLVVFTAGTEYARIVLEGLERDRAEKIRDWLIERGGADGV